MPDEIVTLAQYDRPVDAHLARGQLEVEGISCIVINDGIDNLSVYHAVEPGLVRLQVRAEDRERASEVLGLNLPPEPVAQVNCPHCGSDNVKRRHIFFPLLFVHWIMGCWVRNLAKSPRNRCGDCNARW